MTPAATAPLHARSGGAGDRLLVLLHGLGANGEVWHDVVNLLPEVWEGRWIVPDMRGHGLSPWCSPYGIGQYAADIGAIVGNAGNVTVVGHSLGGVIALALASGWFGVTVDRAVGIGIKVSWTPEEADRMASRSRAPRRRFGNREEAVTHALRIADLAGLVDDDHPFVSAAVEREDGSWSVAFDPAAMSVGVSPMRALIAAAGGDVILACGERDDMVDTSEISELGVPPITLGGCGHNAHVEDPRAVARLLAETCGRTQPRSQETPDLRMQASLAGSGTP